MTEQHPITPPQWLMDAWQARIESMGSNIPEILLDVARWGADKEFEACRECLESQGWLIVARDVLSARRPDPPSLKERALARLAFLERVIAHVESAGLVPFLTQDDSIRLALEQLDG